MAANPQLQPVPAKPTAPVDAAKRLLPGVAIDGEGPAAAASAASAAKPDYPRLEVVSGASAGSIMRLTEGGELSELTVGSQLNRDLRFEDADVADLHARLVGGGARWKVVDLDSATGTYVNDRRVDVSFITAGDRLRFGSVECIFRAPSARSYAARPAQIKQRKVGRWILAATLLVGVSGAVVINAWLNPAERVPASEAMSLETPATVAGIAMPSEPQPGAAAAAGSIPGSVEYGRGQEVYADACGICHNSGVAGAPKLGDVAAWAPRIALGRASLQERAIKGYEGKQGVMPAKGGRADLSDQSVIDAVDYMVANSK